MDEIRMDCPYCVRLMMAEKNRRIGRIYGKA